MYLQSLYIDNVGPLAGVSLNLPFKSSGDPKPLILVGGNGSGKTNLISIIADALFEAAVSHFSNVLPGSTSNERPWFRIAGGTTTRLGASGSFAILQFEHEGKSYFFKAKSGKVTAAEAASRMPENLRPGASWPDEGETKD